MKSRAAEVKKRIQVTLNGSKQSESFYDGKNINREFNWSLLQRESQNILDRRRPFEIGWLGCHFVRDQAGNCDPNGNDMHSSIVIGRQWQNGQCEYLVRNSYGPSLSGQACINGARCEQGNMWIPVRALLAKTVDITDVQSSSTSSQAQGIVPRGSQPQSVGGTR